MAIDSLTLKNEILNDPLGLGYKNVDTTWKTDDVIAGLLNNVPAAASVGLQVSQSIVPSYLVINATDPTEWAALTAQEKQRYQTITGAGQVDASNSLVRGAFGAMFGSGTTTRTNLLALSSKPASRSQVIFNDAVFYWDVARARLA